jgi:hypothetical protein
MNACIFILTINMIAPVYGNDRTTVFNQLNYGDKVCIAEIQGNWMAAHWTIGNQRHGGWLRDVHVAKPAEPAEPN